MQLKTHLSPSRILCWTKVIITIFLTLGHVYNDLIRTQSLGH